MQESDDPMQTAVAQFSINFLRSNRKFYLHYDENNSSLFADATKMY